MFFKLYDKESVPYLQLSILLPYGYLAVPMLIRLLIFLLIRVIVKFNKKYDFPNHQCFTVSGKII